jgi:hypothetical protein
MRMSFRRVADFPGVRWVGWNPCWIFCAWPHSWRSPSS